jgi:hypothetical protein
MVKARLPIDKIKQATTIERIVKLLCLVYHPVLGASTG